jgi:hypothetical protein
MFISALLPGKYDKAAQCKHPDRGQQIQPAVPKSIFQVFPQKCFFFAKFFDIIAFS